MRQRCLQFAVVQMASMSVVFGALGICRCCRLSRGPRAECARRGVAQALNHVRRGVPRPAGAFGAAPNLPGGVDEPMLPTQTADGGKHIRKVDDEGLDHLAADSPWLHAAHMRFKLQPNSAASGPNLAETGRHRSDNTSDRVGASQVLSTGWCLFEPLTKRILVGSAAFGHFVCTVGMFNRISEIV